MKTQVERIAIPKTFLIVYALMIAFAHEYSYWSAFNVQILEHIGITDLPKLALWPIIATGGIALLSMLFGHLLARPLFPPGGGANTPVGVALRRFRIPISIPFFVAGIGSLYWLPDPERWWLIGPSLITAGCIVAIDFLSFWDRLGCVVPHEITGTAIFVLCISFGIGKSQAIDILKGTNYLEAQLAAPDREGLRYLGRAGEYVLLWDATDQVTIVRSLESMQQLRLKHVTSRDNGARQE
jgi:hypothetical protein